MLKVGLPSCNTIRYSFSLLSPPDAWPCLSFVYRRASHKKDQITNKDLLSIFFTVQHTSFMWYSLIFQAKGYDIKCEKSVLRRSCLLVLKWEHYEKKVFKNFFTGATQKKVIFRKKKHQKLLYYNKPLDISGKTTSYLSLGTPEFDICPAIGSQWLFNNEGPLGEVAESEWYVHIL